MKPSYLLGPVLVAVTMGQGISQTPDTNESSDVGPPVVFNGRSFPMFASKVQPVLMNLCARCHCSPDHESGFKLSRVREGYANTQVTGRNVREAVRYLTPDNPAASPLLFKAVTAHGGPKDPPLHSRTHPAFQNLSYWAFWAVSPEGSPVAVAPRPKPVVRMVAATTPVVTEERVPAAVVEPMPAAEEPGEPRKLPPLPPAIPVSPTPSTPQQPAKPNPQDPFDPAAFNGM